MGNTIKNFEKKRRKERKEDLREIHRIIYNALMEKCPFPNELKEKEYEVFDKLIK